MLGLFFVSLTIALRPAIDRVYEPRTALTTSLAPEAGPHTPVLMRIPVRASGQVTTSDSSTPDAVLLGEPATQPDFAWDELVLSWNVQPAAGVRLMIEAQITQGDQVSRWYVMGRWAVDELRGPRQSEKDQDDEIASVDTDTLHLKKPGGRLSVRVTTNRPESLKLITASLVDTHFRAPEEAKTPGVSKPVAWGKVVEVPKRSQMSYPHGNVLCSPTSLSMLLAHWAASERRPEWDRDVPDIVSGVYDRNWGGTGNWPFNTAFAGAQPGIVSYVTRFASVQQLEAFIDDGIPVATSVGYSFLKGHSKREGDDGHLVVLLGFTASGDPIFNDPGRGLEVRQTYKRADFERAWAASNNTVYLVYPTDKHLPDAPGPWLHNRSSK